MKKILTIVFFLLTVSKGYAVQKPEVHSYWICTWIAGAKAATFSCLKTDSESDPCVGHNFHTWGLDKNGKPAKIPLESKCHLIKGYYKGTTPLGREYKYGSMGKYANLLLVFDDYPEDTIPIKDFNPQITNWMSYSYEFIPTASGISYNMYELDSVLPVDSSTLLNNYEIDAFYDGLVTGVVSLDDNPNGIYRVKYSDFNIYPNPTNNYFNVIMPKNMFSFISNYKIHSI